ncbi:hypothetical protein [Sphingosinicella sp. BN140058]|uniref:hypothetical protein n=1 Tax=Sphingosinicella sp. BN140058 TaxID=1892855 RepID=UPI00101075C5|nr:hypothetical protein [Sphingosinicella sp. BN140058]QAY77690.1 hypothetical protein ETR14_15095 [Sphingosinicella sp. BN140058]
MKASGWIAPAAALALAACGSGDERSEASDDLATDNMVTGENVVDDSGAANSLDVNGATPTAS